MSCEARAVEVAQSLMVRELAAEGGWGTVEIAAAAYLQGWADCGAKLERARQREAGLRAIVRLVAGLDPQLIEAGRVTCGQCGQGYEAPACGFAHALIASERDLLPERSGHEEKP